MYHTFDIIHLEIKQSNNFPRFSFDNHQPTLRFQNTYQMDPHKDGRFDKLRCERIIKGLLDTKLANYTYKAKGSARLCCNLSEELKLRVKDEEYNR